MRVFLLIVVLFAVAPCAFAQQPAPQQSPTPDVVTINTELVQTDVMVFDKSGRLVEGLSPAEFVLTLDGKPQPIAFFESIKTGSSQEARQLRRTTPAENQNAKVGPPALAGVTRPGRVILFFVDDVHLSNASLTRTRKALAEFLDKNMHDGDQVAIVSTSGQIGFLQQLTDNDAVLHEAIERLNYKRNPETYAGRTVITDYQANQVAEHNDRALFNYLVSSTMNEYQLVPPKGGDARGMSQLAANNVRNRIRQIEVNSRNVANDTLAVLLSLMRSSSQVPGRKLVFFVSDGFVTDTRGSSAMTLLKRVTEVASRVGIVVYTMEASGIYYDPAIDASRNDFSDGLGSGTAARNWTAESAGMREGLRILAEDTGGRAIVNSNSIPASIQEALDETSSYYLLAWRPDADDQRTGKAQLKVTLKNHPELRVRLRRNFYVPSAKPDLPDSPDSPKTKANAKAGSAGILPANSRPDQPKDSAGTPVPQPELELLKTLGSLYPHKTLPASLAVGYVNTPDQGLVLKLSMQVERWAFNFGSSTDEKKELDVIGAAIDDRGAIVSFKQLLTVTPNAAAEKSGLPVQWNQQLRLPAGLYQVRVALRERGSGRTGSAQQWIAVPEISAGSLPGSLQMSSVFVGERKATDVERGDSNEAGGPGSILVNVTRHFDRSSALRFQTYLYNAGGSAGDVEIEARVLQDEATVMALPAAKVPTDAVKDNALPYWAELSLAGLRPGYYQLQITATDKRTKASAVQRVHFIVQ
jgi:VWFA-related protein